MSSANNSPKSKHSGGSNSPPKKLLLRFPLCFLAFGATPRDRLNAIANWCAYDVGKRHADEMTAAEIKETVSEFNGKMPTGFQKNHPHHVALLLGMIKTRMKGGHVPTMIASVSALNDFWTAMVAKHGRQPYASIWHDLFWEVRDGTGMSYREMSVLAAIVSWLGKRQKAFIARSVITCRALGYKSQAMMDQELPNRNDGEQPLTQSQLQTVTNKLHERKFFARVRKDPWHTYYSMRLHQDDLEKALLGGVDYKFKFHADRKQRAKEFMAAVQAAKSGANVNTANVNTGEGVHDAFTGCSPAVHDAFTLGSFTVLNSNFYTELLGTELQHITGGTLSVAMPCEDGGKAFKELQEEIKDDETPTGTRKPDGTFMTKREFREWAAKLKAEAGIG